MLHTVLPEIAPFLDPDRSVRFLTNELRRVTPYSHRYKGSQPEGKRFVDMLAEVPLFSGKKAWILLHTEVQGKGGKEPFPLRMHRYRCRLEGRYGRPVVAVALLTEPLPAEQTTGKYSWEMFGTKVFYQYQVFKVYEGDENALAESSNPFDLAHLAALRSWKSGKNDRRKLEYMKEILDLLDQRGWSHHEKSQLLTFMEGIMHLNEEEAAQEYEEWEETLEEKKEAGEMYISLMERKGMKIGREEGREEGREKGWKERNETLAVEMLRKGYSMAAITDLTGLTEEEIRTLAGKSSG
jgi:predicted transposase YdaD